MKRKRSIGKKISEAFIIMLEIILMLAAIFGLIGFYFIVTIGSVNFFLELLRINVNLMYLCIFGAIMSMILTILHLRKLMK